MFGIKFVCFRILGRSGGDEGVEDEEGVGGIEEIGKVIGIWWIKEVIFWDIWGVNKVIGMLFCGWLRF